MVAHLDAVTSLAVDPNGIYLMSGSKSHSVGTFSSSLSVWSCGSRLMVLGFWSSSPFSFLPQVTTALCVCGTSTVKRAFRRSQLTARRARKPSTMWLSTPLRPTLLPPEPTPSPGSTSRPGQEEGEAEDPQGERRTESTAGKQDAGCSGS